MAEMKYPWRDDPMAMTLREHLDFYKLAEAYKGDRGSVQYDPTPEGFVSYLHPYIGELATSQEVEIEEIKNEQIDGFPTNL